MKRQGNMNRGNTPNLESWNPMEEDYSDPDFNSYVGRRQEMMPQQSRGHDVYALHVRNIPKDMTESGLKHLFMKCGDVLDVSIHTPAGMLTPSFHYGKVYFRSTNGAYEALKRFDQTPPLFFSVELDWHQFGRDGASLYKGNSNRFNGRDRRPLLPTPSYDGHAGVEKIAGRTDFSSNQPLSITLQSDCTSRMVRLTQNTQTNVNPAGSRVHSPGQNSVQPGATCVKCRSIGALRCTKCKAVYCSDACQKADWNVHKHVCLPQSCGLGARQPLLNTPPTKQDHACATVTGHYAPRQPPDGRLSGGKSFEGYRPQNCAHRDYGDRRPQNNAHHDNGRQYPQNSAQYDDGSASRGRGDYQRPQQSRPHAAKWNDSQQTMEDAGDKGHQKYGQQKGTYLQQPLGDAGNKRGQKFGEQRGSYQPKPEIRKPSIQEYAPASNQHAKRPPPVQKEHKIHPISLSNSTKVQIAHIGDPHTFYVHLDKAEDLAFVMRKVQAVEKDSPPAKVSVGQIVAAKFSDDVWYRAKVEKLEKGKYAVMFLDYGNLDTVGLNDLRALSSDIANLPVQAVWCRLANVQPINGKWSDDALNCFNIFTDGIPLYVTIVKTCGGQACVTMKDEPQNGDDIGMLIIKSGCAIEALPIHCSCLSDWQSGQDICLVTPTQEKLGKVWASNMEGIPADQLALILSKLSEVCNALPNGDEFNVFGVGTAVAAQSPTDNAWYRGVVLKVETSGWLVRYLDFGNCEEVSNLRVLPSEFQQSFSLAVCLRFDERYAIECVPEVFMPDDSLKMKVVEVIGDTAVVDIIFGEGGPTCQAIASSIWKFTDGFEVQSTLMEECEAAKSPSPQPHKDELQKIVTSPSPMSIGDGIASLPKAEIPEGQTMIFLMWIESLDQFSVQIATEEKVLLLAKVAEELQVAGESDQLETLGKTPAIGQLVCGRFSLDGRWYRCLVEAIDASGGITISFIDFGNTEVTRLENLKPLPNAFYDICPLSFNVSVTMAISLPLEMLRATLIPNDSPAPFLMTVVDKAAIPIKAVLMTIDGRTLEEHLSDCMPDSKTESKEEARAFECMPDSRAEPEEPAHGSECNLDTNAEPEEQAYASECSSEMASLHIEASNVEKQVPCVANVADACLQIHEMTEDLRQEAAEAPQVVEINMPSSTEETPVVNAFAPNFNVVDLEIGKSIDLLVVDVQSPDGIFAFQCDMEEIAKYDLLAEDITEYCVATSDEGYVPEVNAFCLAKSVEFDLWYRAFVISNANGKCKVYFADYGNIETVDSGSIRRMPEKFQEIPVQVVQFAIAGLKKIESFSKDECEAFKKILSPDEKVTVEIIGKCPDSTYTVRVPSLELSMKKLGFAFT